MCVCVLGGGAGYLHNNRVFACRVRVSVCLCVCVCVGGGHCRQCTLCRAAAWPHRQEPTAACCCCQLSRAQHILGLHTHALSFTVTHTLTLYVTRVCTHARTHARLPVGGL